MVSKNLEILNKLLRASTADDVALIIESEKLLKEVKWIPIGSAFPFEYSS